MTERTDPTDRLDEYVASLDRTAPGGGTGDLAALADAFEGKRVVGLGEATHGTREFFRLKHRLVRLLVTELDVRLIGLEANFAEVRRLDEYVATGDGDAEAALDALSYWTWRTEGLLALVEWVREYNRDRPASERVRLYGLDVRSTAGPARALRAFLERVDPDYLPQIADDLRTLEAGWVEDGHEVTAEQVATAEAVATELAGRFEEHEDDYRSAAGDGEWRLARRRRRLVERAGEFAAASLSDGGDSPNAVRDAAMAENVGWILDYEGADRIALWAHNGHVRTGTIGGGRESSARTMGHHLRREFGDDYYALGFEFGRGSFQAIPDPGTVDELAVRVHEMDAIPDGSLPAVMDQVGEPVCYLDVASAAEDPAVRAWLERERPMHRVGAVYFDDPDAHYVPVELAQAYDGLVYVAETEPSVPAGEG